MYSRANTHALPTFNNYYHVCSHERFVWTVIALKNDDDDDRVGVTGRLSRVFRLMIVYKDKALRSKRVACDRITTASAIIVITFVDADMLTRTVGLDTLLFLRENVFLHVR